MGGVSGPEVEPSLGRASNEDETGAEIGDDTVDASVVANTVVGVCLTPTTGAMLGGKMLKSTESFNNDQLKYPVTHFIPLSEFESMSIDDGVGARDKRRKEDNFPLKDPATFLMRV